MAFVFYRLHGSSFLSNQLYGNLQALVKSAFFCIAHQQLLDSTQPFRLYQIGSDRLEEMFAEVRTESELSDRLSDAADTLGIYDEHPEWHQGHVRRSWSGKETDHVNPTYFTGDTIVGNVVCETVWRSGYHAARDFLGEHGIDFDFDTALSEEGVDFICPKGRGIYPGISKDKDRSIINPTTPASTLPTAAMVPAIDSDDEDEETDDSITGVTTSILSTLFNSEYRHLAVGRLLCVRCYTKDGGRKPNLNHQEFSGEHSFNVNDIAVALVRTGNFVAAAVVKVTVIEKDKHRLCQIDTEEKWLWLWTGEYAKFDPLKGPQSTVKAGTRKALTVKVPGAFVHPLDAEIEDVTHLPSADRRVLVAKHIPHVWVVANNDLAAVVSTLYNSLDSAAVLKLLPKHGNCPLFPYLDSSGAAAFMVNNPTLALAEKNNNSEKILCHQCHIYIKPEDTRGHVGGHIFKSINSVSEPNLFEKTRKEIFGSYPVHKYPRVLHIVPPHSPQKITSGLLEVFYACPHPVSASEVLG
ncbi:hypothetical protein FB451DRAFT_1172794 [Mycena latifolia]|nr:hypothetical protein FB451DRAFT_1172794 [Mycena latifolia]